MEDLSWIDRNETDEVSKIRRKKQYAIFDLFILTVFITGCASTSITSFRDPSFAAKSFYKILVMSPFADLESRTKAESAFVERLAKHSVEGIPSISVFMPTRTYTNEELFKLLSENSIDGVLLVTLTDASSNQVYIPAFSSTYGQASLTGNTLNYSANTFQAGGYYVSRPQVHYEIQLYDVLTGNTAWVATSLTRGSASTNFDILIGSLADTAIEKLREDGLLMK